MGTFFRSIAARTAAAESIKALVMRWLSAKGFEASDATPLFALDDSERGVFLFSNSKWVVVLYSQMEAEGERLRHELTKLQVPLLEVWVHDSDIWGYDLYDDENLVVSFNSNPNYFGFGSQLPLSPPLSPSPRSRSRSPPPPSPSPSCRTSC